MTAAKKERRAVLYADVYETKDQREKGRRVIVCEVLKHHAIVAVIVNGKPEAKRRRMQLEQLQTRWTLIVPGA